MGLNPNDHGKKVEIQPLLPNSTGITNVLFIIVIAKMMKSDQKTRRLPVLEI